MRYADVIVPLAVEGMYTYTVPVSLESEVREGTLVLVSFAGNSGIPLWSVVYMTRRLSDIR